MNILFLTMLCGMDRVEVNGIYTDLMRKFRDEGHEVYIVYPQERRLGLSTQVSVTNHVHSIGVKTLNVTQTNVVEKGMGQIFLEYQFGRALKKYFGTVRFDVILYSTPPITFTRVIKYAKKCNPHAMSYLLLKDIFPQNAVDLGMLTTYGLKGLIYKMFRAKEKALYRVSDFIGCMSPANVKYVRLHNPEVNPNIIEIAPNSFDVSATRGEKDQSEVRKKYNLPTEKPIFIYGGNMGKPQGIPFLIKCLNAVKDREDCHFVVAGSGTEFSKVETWVKEAKPKAISLFHHLPSVDYNALASACDVGLIFLDYRFTIPNYPSRLLSYLMECKPIIAATDPNCDTGIIAEENGYGFWCPSNSVEAFVAVVDKMLVADIKKMGKNGYEFYLNNYMVEHTYQAVMKHLVR